jgi:hypothetical protein
MHLLVIVSIAYHFFFAGSDGSFSLPLTSVERQDNRRLPKVAGENVPRMFASFSIGHAAYPIW